MTGMLRAGAVHYHALPPTAFDEDWGIGREPALRWFSRACADSERLTSHKPCGAPTYDARRKTLLTRDEYVGWAYEGSRKDQTVGCYFSPNLFYRWRNQAQLTGFCANWIEIDTKGHGALSEAREKTLLAEVGDALWKSGLPMPTSVVLTGSGGVHLYWLYKEPVMSKSAAHRESLLGHWRTLNQTLVNALERSREAQGYLEWAVDRSASNNPTGVMRLPGSVHAKTGRSVQYLRGGKRVDFSTFAKDLGLSVKAPTAPVVQQKKPSVVQQLKKPAIPARHQPHIPSSASREPGVAQGYDSPVQQRILRLIMEQWEAFLAHRQQVPVGQRDLTAFHLYNCARRVMPDEQAWAYIERLNERYIGLPMAKLKAYLSTASQKVYYYALPTLRRVLCEELGLPLRFPKTSGTGPLSASEIAKRQSKAGQRTSTTLRQRTVERLVADLAALCQQGVRTAELTKAMAQRHTEVSRATLYRYWDAVMNVLSRKETPTLKELVQSVRECLNRYPFSYNATGESGGFGSVPEPGVFQFVSEAPVLLIPPWKYQDSS